jgi:hypothetical protein
MDIAVVLLLRTFDNKNTTRLLFYDDFSSHSLLNTNLYESVVQEDVYFRRPSFTCGTTSSGMSMSRFFSLPVVLSGIPAIQD